MEGKAALEVLPERGSDIENSYDHLWDRAPTLRVLKHIEIFICNEQLL